jgi:hypothetical protein
MLNSLNECIPREPSRQFNRRISELLVIHQGVVNFWDVIGCYIRLRYRRVQLQL